MNKQIWVIAPKGLFAPKEGAFSGRVTDQKPEQVTASRYYSRLIKDGSLIELTDEKANALLNPVEKKAGKK